MFANLFVSLLVGVMFWYWVCLFVGWWLSFNSRDGVSVELFYYRADYWPYLWLIYLFFSLWPSVVMCITICFMFGVVWVLGFFFLVISICTELLCFGRGI